MKRGPFPGVDGETRKPVDATFRSCDCQFHIYGDPRISSQAPALYEPPNATFDDMKGVLSILGIDRGVSFTNAYDTDNTALSGCAPIA